MARKPDYSNYLAHFTSDTECVQESNCLPSQYQGKTAKEKLISILQTKTIHKSTMPWTNSYAVCFTECPWSSFIEHSERYSPYGIGFTKKFIFGKHGGPVFYMRVDDFINQRDGNFKSFSDSIKYLITPFQPKYTPSRMKRIKNTAPVDYTHEREWRMPDNLHFEYKDIIFVVVKSNEDFASFPLDLKRAIGSDRFLVIDNYKTIEKLWPIHII